MRRWHSSPSQLRSPFHAARQQTQEKNWETVNRWSVEAQEVLTRKTQPYPAVPLTQTNSSFPEFIFITRSPSHKPTHATYTYSWQLRACVLTSGYISPCPNTCSCDYDQYPCHYISTSPSIILSNWNMDSRSLLQFLLQGKTNNWGWLEKTPREWSLLPRWLTALLLSAFWDTR